MLPKLQIHENPRPRASDFIGLRSLHYLLELFVISDGKRRLYDLSRKGACRENTCARGAEGSWAGRSAPEDANSGKAKEEGPPRDGHLVHLMAKLQPHMRGLA